MRKYTVFAGMLLASCAFALSGCKSEKGNGRPIFEIEESAEQSYEMTTVKRGTIKKTGIVAVSYVQMQQEILKFQVSGKRLASINVSVGSTVKKGDLLAELSMESEEATLADYEYSIELKELQKKQLTEQRDFQKAALERKRWNYSAAEYQEKQDELKHDYDYKIEDLEDELVLLRWQKDELQKVLDGSKLYAGIDGTITKLVNTKGYVSNRDENFLTISDSTVCAFQGYGVDLAQYLTLGQEYTFHTSDNEKEYIIKLTEVDVGKGTYTFVLPETDYSIPIGLRVLCTITKEMRENVLYLPKAAVHEADGKYYVYYIDEDGIRRMKDVEAGLDADEEMEIISGLAEGEEVILD